MSIIAVATAKGSPGATTLAMALALARPIDRRCIVIEADPDGGSMAARLGLGYEPGLVELASASRRDVPDALTIDRVAQELGNGIAVVPSPPSAEQVHAALSSSAPALAKGLSALTDADCIVDLGRISGRSPALELTRRATVTLLLARPDLVEVQHLPSRVDVLRRSGAEVELLCVGTRPYDPAEVAGHLGVPLFGVWADDAAMAAGVWQSGSASKRVRKSIWWRSTMDIASSVWLRVAQTHLPSTVDLAVASASTAASDASSAPVNTPSAAFELF